MDKNKIIRRNQKIYYKLDKCIELESNRTGYKLFTRYFIQLYIFLVFSKNKRNFFESVTILKNYLYLQQ